jgi:hypothetical protein
MAQTRITYRNWIVEAGRDPASPIDPDEAGRFLPADTPAGDEPDSVQAIREAVDKALADLSPAERDFIIRFYFLGESYNSMSEETGRRIHKLEALHRRAIRRLRSKLAPFVAERFGIGASRDRACPICRSRARTRIDRLIRQRDPEKTWRPVIRRIRSQFGIEIKTPQMIIGHEKYH